MTSIKYICCTCLCEDRKLYQLCRVPDGVNLLYMLLMCDDEAYREGFYKDTASWMVCWECCAIIKRIKRFRLQACIAQTRLKELTKLNGFNKEIQIQSLSCMSTCINQATNVVSDTFIDCGNINQVKTESAHSIDNFQDELTDQATDTPTTDNIYNINRTRLKKKVDKMKDFFKIFVMDNEELNSVIGRRKLELHGICCDSCVLDFENESDLNAHNLETHTKKDGYSLCSICLSYVKDSSLATHTSKHYRSYACVLCDYKVNTRKLIIKHIKEIHRECTLKKEKQLEKGSSSEPVKYPCSECDMTFVNKGAKWKHVQKSHRPGHTCDVCHKVFSFKHNLHRHELIHKGTAPSAECPVCQKRVRSAVLRAHVRTHGARARAACAPCGKAFICRATYESHLKYSRAHATINTLRHACTSCEKKYRSRGELRDHVAYRHDARASYKCPVCDKSLATRRCVTRHVRRAHEGRKENARDKMCDYCGKAFRDKQSLLEHVSRHTGARPLTCAHCGRAFRQRAALYAHARRLHPAPLTPTIMTT